MLICQEKDCTGCMAYVSVCAKGAISVSHDSSGFSHPVIDEGKCVKCNRCKTICPVNIQNKNEKEGDIYAAWQKKESDRLAATSGGVFTAIAQKFLKDGGIVYGAAFDENNCVRHIRATTEVDGLRLRGSKYVQSDTLRIYDCVVDDLKKGNKVLFSGTPCQISAMKSIAKSHLENLYCVDIVCHGVPSPKVFSDYIEDLNCKYQARAKDISFRYKVPGWSVFSMRVLFDNGEEYVASKFKDPYLGFFLAGGDLTLRESCFQCKFTSPERCGDITLADFWCIRATKQRQRGIEKGVNLVAINSPKGESLFRGITDELYFEKRKWSEAYASNQSFKKPWKKPANYEEFWKDYSRLTFSEMVDKYHKYDEVAEAEQIREAEKRATIYKTPYPIRFLMRVFRKIGRKLRAKIR